MPSSGPPKYSAEGQDNRPTAGLPTETNFDPLSEQNPDQHQEPTSPTGSHMSIDDYFAPYTRLDLSETPTPPTISTTLAHLKLLEAFYILRETVAFKDGVFGIWDAWAGPEVTGNAKDRDARLKRLAQIREKRWALYVVRAADRFATWWELALCTHPSAEPRIRISDMSLPEYEHIAVDVQKVVMFADNDLPPLDVLMVWHAFMLNPRCYLEDCIRFGLMKLWAAGMPWYCIDKVLDGGGSYQAPEDTQRNFVSKSGRPWDNLVEPESKIIDCPRCLQELSIPWTTCSGTEHSTYHDKDSLVGSGFAESDLSHRCPACQYKVTHDSLRVVNFMEDAEAMFTSDWPLKGTLLFGRHGTPRVFDDRRDTSSPQGASFVFANIIVRELMREEIHDLIPVHGNEPSGMGRIRDILGVKVQGRIREERARSLNYRMPREERLSIRKMMSRYWDNHSRFALDLSGAVIRQCVFMVKMHNIDWLHSPAARKTMGRLIMKYDRFFDIIALNPCECAVPTLDVDLAWHTHQLSPQDYYEYSVKMTEGKFIDHDDKIDENDLNTSFEWTSKTYQERYKEAYSDCTCWYCEAIRSSHIKSKLFSKKSNHEKIAIGFYQDQVARDVHRSAPNDTPHISSHNAVRLKNSVFGERVTKELTERREKYLEAAYKKACARARKKGVKMPDRENYLEDGYGVGYPRYGPWLAPAFITAELYPGGDPCSINTVQEAVGNCCQGTCRGTVAAGVCAPGGACGGGCTGGGGQYTGGRHPHVPMMNGGAAGAVGLGFASGGTASGCGGGGGGC